MTDSATRPRRSPIPRPRPVQVAPDAPIKHVIAEYKHQAQTVTCVCGWHGSTVESGAQRSDWALHVAANRIRRP